MKLKDIKDIPEEPLTPEEERLIVSVTLGCFIPMVFAIILLLLLIICSNA